MSQPITNSPIFIIGSYRSGTSVLTWCLGQHPNILPLPETYWLAQLTTDMQRLYEKGSSNGRFSHLSALDWDEFDFYSALGKAINQFVVDTREPRLSFVYRQSAKKNGLTEEEIEKWLKKKPAFTPSNSNYQIVRRETDPKQRWVDGTPDNTFNAYGLSLLFPQAKFIHILRNPNDVARSLMNFSRVGNNASDYKESDAYSAWQKLTESAVKTEQALGNQKVMRIYYEDIINDSKTNLEKCIDFLGESFSSDCLLPLREKINSSKVETPNLPKPNPHCHKGILANKYYELIRNTPPPKISDTNIEKELNRLFKLQSKSFFKYPLNILKNIFSFKNDLLNN